MNGSVRMARLEDTSAVGWRQSLWPAFLVLSSVAFTFGFACAVPFAALGAAAALTLKPRAALAAVGVAWLLNQIVGFACLGYPWTADSLFWGAVLGLVALLSTVTAQFASERLATRTLAAALLGFVVAFVVYEGGLFLVSAGMPSESGDFAMSTVARILAINAAAFFALLAVNRLAATMRFMSVRPIPLRLTPQA